METFTEYVKRDMLEAKPTIPCGKAWLGAIIRTSASICIEKHGLALKFESENDTLIRTVVYLIRAIYHAPIEASVDKIKAGLRKGQLTYSAKLSQGTTRELLTDCGLMKYMDGQYSPECGIDNSLVNTEAKRSTFLKAMFIGCGTASIPDRYEQDGTRSSGYHLEFRLLHEALAVDLISVLRLVDIEAKYIERKDCFVVYIKDRELLSNFFAYVGSGVAVMKIQEIIIEREVNNRLNRQSNFSAANLDRTVKASVGQYHALKVIDKHLGIENLPDELRVIADMRMADRFATLNQMQEALPDVGKSGINHRWRKIMKIAADLIERYGDIDDDDGDFDGSDGSK